MACRVLGTPNEQTWPGVSNLPDYKTSFPHWSAEDLGRIVTALDDAGLDLLKVPILMNCICLLLIIRRAGHFDIRHCEAHFRYFILPHMLLSLY